MYRLINKAFDYFNRKSPVLVQTPRIRHIGNCAEEMYFGLLRAKREHKKVLFLFLQHPLFWKFAQPVANRELLCVESDHIVRNGNWYGHLGGWLLTVVFGLMRVTYLLWRSAKLRRMICPIWPNIRVVVSLNRGYIMPTIGASRLWKAEGVNYFSWDMVAAYRWEEQFKEYQPPRLSKEKHEYAGQLRVQMGIPLADWFVCLHVRESGYRNDSAIYRNASIQNYTKGIKVITAAGGWVVRIGDPTMTPLPQIEHVIDYPYTPFKSELMDIYLISQCRFFIGVNSGPSDVATLFKKPMILVNAPEWSIGFPLKKGDLAIIKHTFSRSRNRFLPIREILEEPFSCQAFGGGSDEYVKVENTSEEIRDVIEEFLAKPEDYEYSQLQEAFNEGRSRQIHQWVSQEPYLRAFSKDDFIEGYRIASRCDSAAGTLGQKYLEQNWFTDNLEKSSFRPLVGSFPSQP